MQVHAFEFSGTRMEYCEKIDIKTFIVHVEIHMYTFLLYSNDLDLPNPPVFLTCAFTY